VKYTKERMLVEIVVGEKQCPRSHVELEIKLTSNLFESNDELEVG